MNVARERSEVRDGRFDGLHAEAEAALADAGTTLRGIRERYRRAYRDELARWQAIRDQLDAGDADPADTITANSHPDAGPQSMDATPSTLRDRLDQLAADIERDETQLNRLEVAHRSLERTLRFLEHEDGPLSDDLNPAALPADGALRVVEAQEAERSRLAQEVHDGPAQALTNAIFQVEYIERVIDHDQALARTELRFLRQLLRRELGDVRTFISHLRPRVLDQLGLDGSIRETVDNMAALTGLPINADLFGPGNRLDDAEQTVVLRIVQEGLQNVRKHASATSARVSTRIEHNAWVLEIRDDGRGFDMSTVTARGGRNFGLQFMAERAELIGARFEVRSHPDGGTVVWLAIPLREESR